MGVLTTYYTLDMTIFFICYIFPQILYICLTGLLLAGLILHL